MAEQERAKTGAGALKTQGREKPRTAGNGRERGAAKDGR